MPNCNCGAHWQWSVCHDVFIDENEKEYAYTDLTNFEANPTFDNVAARVVTCSCGKINVVIIDGEYFFECDEFKGVEWI